MTPGSIHTHVDWQQWMRVFDLPVTSAALPLRTTCPVCATGSLLLYDDPIGGGQWAWCRDCRIAGDLIHIASRVWNCDTAVTVKRLVRHHGFQIPLQANSVDLYTRNCHKPLRVGRRLWDASQRYFAKSNTQLRHKVHQLGCPVPDQSTRFQQLHGQLIGAAKSLDLELALFPRGHRPKRSSPGKVSLSGKLFKGDNWSEVLVLPRWSLPGRLAGFTFARGWTEKDTVPYYFGDEGGLAFHPLTMLPRTKDERRIIATRNLRLFMQMQCRQLTLEGQPLPLVHWVSGQHATDTAWSMFRGLELTLWEPKITATVLIAAYRLNCHISVSEGGLAHQDRGGSLAREQVPSEVTAAVLRGAKPWHEVLSLLIRQLDDEALQTLLSELQQKRVDVPQMLVSCSIPAQQRVRTLAGDTFEHRSLSINRQLLVERDGHWYCRERHGSGELVADAILKIDRVVYRQRRQQTLYQGRIIYRQKEVTFCEQKEVLERRTFHWMQQQLMEAGLGIMRFNPAWRQYAVAIATQIQPPLFVRGADLVGWDDVRKSLVLPRFEVPLGAEPRLHEGGFQPDDPAFLLDAPRVVAPTDFEALGGTTLRSALLTTVAAAAAVVLAPAVKQPMPNILLSGANAASILQACSQAFGAVCGRPKTPRECGKLAEAAQQNGWPYVLDNSYCKPRAFRRWIAQHEGADGLITTSTDADAAAAMMLTGQWYLLDVSRCGLPSADAVTAASQLFLRYLAEVVGRNLDYKINGDWLQTVMNDFRNWVRRYSEAQIRPLLAIPDDDTLASVFSKTLGVLHARGLLTFDKPGRLTALRENIRRQRVVVLPKQGYLSLLNELWDVAVSPFTIVTAIGAALIEDRGEAWVIDEVWLGQRQRDLGRNLLVHEADTA